MNHRSYAAFTLIEVLISMAVLSLSFAALTGLLLTSMRANRANIDDFLAYNLAQEGLEAVRNIRDSNWLSNFSWTGSTATFVDEDGNTISPSNSLDSSSCLIGGSSFFRVSINYLFDPDTNYNPWMVECLTFDPTAAENINHSDLFLYEHSDFGFVHAMTSDCCDVESKSRFRRYLEVSFVDVGGEPQAGLRVKSVVGWNEVGKEESLVLSTILTDWKKGPL